MRRKVIQPRDFIHPLRVDEIQRHRFHNHCVDTLGEAFRKIVRKIRNEEGKADKRHHLYWSNFLFEYAKKYGNSFTSMLHHEYSYTLWGYRIAKDQNQRIIIN